jgi:signal peptidase I
MDVGCQHRSSLACELVSEVASDFGTVCLRVTGASMLPAIWPGDVVQVRRSETVSPRAGQIVLARRQGGLVVHRIARIEGDWLVTRGDANADEDSPVAKSDVLGEVVSMMRHGRLVLPRQSLRLRMCSAILRRSDFCLRMALRVNRLMRQCGSKELSWSS